MSIKATLPVKLKVSELDPARISFADEYTVLEHLYSPLVEYNSKGELTAGIAKKFEWKGNEAYFTIRDDLVLSNGRRLDSSDVLNSLKRLILLDSNVHGKIGSLLCPEDTIKKLSDECDHLRVKDDQLIISLKKKNPFLFKMLASIDYAILPREVIDEKTLKINNYKLSTGPYSLVSENNGTLSLAANENHYHYSKKMPQTITFIVPDQKSIELIENGKIDVITTDDNTSEPDELLKFAKNNGYEAHESFKIKTNLLMFTRKGLNRINADRRLKIGKIIRDVFSRALKNDSSSEVADQFFPALGEVGLSDLGRSKLQKIYNSVNTTDEDGNGISLYVSKKRLEFVKKIIHTVLPKMTILTLDEFPDFFSEEESTPDIVFSYTDSGFLEQIGLINYSINIGCFGLDKAENEKWLNKYGDEEDKSKRLSMLEDLHLNALSMPQIVPLYHSSYVAVTNKKWTFNLSKYYSNTKLWLMRKK